MSGREVPIDHRPKREASKAISRVIFDRGDQSVAAPALGYLYVSCMSTQQPNPFAIPENVKRPGSVVIVAICLFIIGLLNLVAAGGAVYLATQPGDSQTLYGAPASDFFFWFNALMSFLLFLIYLWLGRGQLKGNAQAWGTTNVLMFINIFFAFFQLFYGTGFVAMLFCLIVLLLNNVGNAKAYFMSNLPPEIKAQVMAAQEQAEAARAAAAAVAARQAADAAAAAQAQVPPTSTPTQTPPSA